MFNCMRFEALHQKFKRFAKHCGFKNVGFTMSKKYQNLQSTYFSKTDPYPIHPILQDNIICNTTKSKISSVTFYGRKIPIKKNIVLTYVSENSNKFGIILEWIKIDDKLHARITKLDKISFSNELLAYEVKDCTEIAEIPESQILNSFGEIYKYSEKNYLLISQLI